MRFHESLPTCLAVLHAADIPIDENTLVLRDAVGRLTVARVNLPNRSAISDALALHLEGYAAQPPIVDGALAQRLLDDPDARVFETGNGDHRLTIRYIDRRLTGVDWLVEPTFQHRSEAIRIVFASIKGGVGRSTALCVAAANLASQGKRILVVDLDLEAPGIGFMLLPGEKDGQPDRRPRFGVIDYLLENGVSEISDESLIDFVGTSSFHDGSIDVIPAVGRVTDDHPDEFIQKLARAVIEDIRGNEIIPLWKQVQSMIERFESRKAYDAILIDARAGLAEISAAPLLSLGAYIVFFATDQEQTFRGYRFLLSHMSSRTDYARLNAEDDWRQKLMFVQSKAGGTQRSRMGFRERVYDLCAEWLYEEEAETEEISLAFSPAEEGAGVPHDATFIRYDAAYDAFDPSIHGDQLDSEVYSGPFGSFLGRIDLIIADENSEAL